MSRYSLESARTSSGVRISRRRPSQQVTPRIISAAHTAALKMLAV